MRLPRSRRGKTEIDVGVVVQAGLPRVRITLGDNESTNKRNTDLDFKEVEDLIVMLQYKLAEARGDV